MSFAIQAGTRVFTFRIDTGRVEAVCQRVCTSIRLILQSVFAAALVWLLLAAPGVVSDRASTTAPIATRR